MQALIDELDELVQNAKKVPVSGKLLVDEAAMRRIVNDMRAAMPDEVRVGQRIASERDRILAEARAQARRIVEDAQSQVGARVEDQNIVQAARQRAREIQQEAERTSAALRAEADQYVMNQFQALEARLIRVLREVQAGQRALTPPAGERESAGHSS
jgi:hypothetical protein